MIAKIVATESTQVFLRMAATAPSKIPSKVPTTIACAPSCKDGPTREEIKYDTVWPVN